MMWEERDFFPAALKALSAQEWTEIASAVTGHGDPLFGETATATSDALRAHILKLEQEAEAERSSVALSSTKAGNPRHGAERGRVGRCRFTAGIRPHAHPAEMKMGVFAGT
ncbi:hypothetical protein [Bradyrhizobium sp. AC87j1]|uniref:hypothetical protein n=1 Tax=Bradyrhizobium sp. AC87j1 TaxID=2055894 RepID=UPI001FDFD93C|nr:hypothetical protein [Bradyrhizobium sp. AC87j1]